MKFTGLKIEQHGILGEKMCVAYQDDERVACLYFHPHEHKTVVIYEPDKTALQVHRRIPGTYVFKEEPVP
jgi:hypothetical protein